MEEEGLVPFLPACLHWSLPAYLMHVPCVLPALPGGGAWVVTDIHGTGKKTCLPSHSPSSTWRILSLLPAVGHILLLLEGGGMAACRRKGLVWF